MKSLFLSICIFFIPLASWSETYFVTGTVQSVEPVYTNSNLIVPERRCRNIKVPVYGQVTSSSGASGADVCSADSSFFFRRFCFNFSS